MSSIGWAPNEGDDERANLQAVIDKPDDIYSNPQVGLKYRAIQRMEQLDEQKGEALSTIASQLHNRLSQPLFVGATPSTPFRIATLVSVELADHSHFYSYCEKPARVILERWFAEHPNDILQQPTRKEIVVDAMRTQLSSLSERAQISILGPSLAALVHVCGPSEAIDLFILWTIALPAQLSERLIKRVRTLADTISPLSLFPNFAAESSSVSALADQTANLGVDPDAHLMPDTAVLREQVVERGGIVAADDPHARAIAAEEAQRLMQQQMAAMQQQMAAMQRAPVPVASVLANQQEIERAADLELARQRDERIRARIQQRAEEDRLDQAAAPRRVYGASPAADVMIAYGRAKALLASDGPVGRRFQSNIVGPMQQEVDGLRAQVNRLSGILHPSDPAYTNVVREARARFAKPGSLKLFDRREIKLEKLNTDLGVKEKQVATLLEEIGVLRIESRLYTQQVEADREARDDNAYFKKKKVDHWVKEAEIAEARAEERQKLADNKHKRKMNAANFDAAAAAAAAGPRPPSRAASIASSNYAAARRFLDDEAAEDSC